DRARHPGQSLSEDRPGPLGPVERDVRLVNVHAVADHAPGVRLDHLGNGVHRAEPTLGVRLEDEAVMAEQALGPVPGARSPFLDLRPNAESDARVLLEPLHEALGLVEVAIRLAGFGLSVRI